MVKSQIKASNLPWPLIIIFLLLGIGIGTSGYFYYKDQKEQIKKTAGQELSGIADLKVRQISSWRKERLGDAAVISESLLITFGVHQYLENPKDSGLRRNVLTWMGSLQKNYEYERVMLFDKKGMIKLSVPEKSRVVCSYTQQPVLDVIHTKRIILADFHRSEPTGSIHLGLVVPLLVQQGRNILPIGVLLLEINPYRFLYPFIQSWPTPSQTSETLLVRREGDEVVYLNELRHLKDTALHLRFPLSKEQLPAALVVQGKEGVVEGLDYRGVPVVAAIRSIPESPWFFVAKVDKEEIYKLIHERAWMVAILSGLIIGFAGITLGLIWRHQRAQFYHKLYEGEVERGKLAQRLDFLTKHANDMIVLLDDERKIVDVNDRAVESYGYTRDELLQRSGEDLRPPEFRPFFDEQIEQVNEHNGFLYETLHQKKDGTTFPVEISSRPIWVGEKKFYQSIIRDITERKQMEESLRDSQTELSAIIENAPIVMLLVDRERQVRKANGAAIKFAGHPAEEMIGLRSGEALRCLHSLDDPRGCGFGQSCETCTVRNVVIDTLEAGKSHYAVEAKLPFDLTGKAEEKYLLLSTIPLTIREEQLALVCIEDITERKRAEKALQESEKKYRQVIENATEIIYTVDEKGNFTYANPAGLKVTGYPLEELQSFNYTDLVLPEHRQRVGESYADQFRQKRLTTHVEFPFFNKAGGITWFSQNSTLVIEDGKVLGFHIIARDITERKRIEEALEMTQFSVEHAPESVLWINSKGQLNYANEAACRVLGYSREELVSMFLWDIDPDFNRERWSTHWQGLPKRGPSTRESHHRTKEGKIFPVEITSDYLKYGEKEYNVAFVRDITGRKKAEDSLRESVETLRAFLNANPEVSFLVDTKGTVLVANESLFKRFNKSSEEIIGHCLYDLFPEDVTKKRKYHFDEVFRTGKPVYFEDVRLDRNYETFVHPVFDKEGNVGAVAILGFDITERKQTEEALRSSEEKYRTIHENIEEGYYEVDIAGNFTFLNESMCRIYGYPKEELMGMNDRQYTDKENAKRLFETFNKVYRTGEPQIGYDYEIIRKDGAKRYVETSILLQKDSSGKPLGFRGIIRDITDRKLAEESLKQSEENAKLLAQENGAMAEIGRIISSTLNIDEIYESFSREVKKIISFDRIVINIIDTEKGTVKNVYIAGKGLRDREGKDVYPLEGSGNAEMVRTKRTLLIQAEDFNEYKDRFPMLLSTFQSGFRSIMNVPLFSKGEIIGGLLLRSRKPYAYTDKDVRLAERIGSQIAGAIANAQLYAERIQAEKERVALEEQLRQSQKIEAIGQLAGGVAHDFNNILTVIKGYSQLSLAEMKEEDPFRENIEEIKKSADRAADLTRQLLAFSRRQMMEMKVLDLNTILSSLDKMLRRVIGEDIELVTILAEDLGGVKTDPGQIEQVIMNLAVNAKDAMTHGGKLIIETANVGLDEKYARNHIAVKPGRYVMLSVSDTGVGMPPEIRDRIFEPFFTTKEKGKGTGLGLSTVYGIVKQSNGNIWVYSEPGKGTTIKIYLPRVDEPLEELKERIETKELPRGNETILLVEDDEEVRKLAMRILREQGYEILGAAEGIEAFLLCEEHEGLIHLLVTDVVMPKMSGRELADRVASIRPEIKVLYMSGYTDNAIVHHGVLAEGVNYIQKPFTVESLVRKVREVIDK